MKAQRQAKQSGYLLGESALALAVLGFSMLLFAQAQQSLSAAHRHNQAYAAALELALDVATRLQLNPAGDYLGVWQPQPNASACANLSAPCRPQQLVALDNNEVLAVAGQNLANARVELSSCSAYTCINLSWEERDCSLGQCLQLSFVAPGDANP